MGLPVVGSPESARSSAVWPILKTDPVEGQDAQQALNADPRHWCDDAQVQYVGQFEHEPL